MPEIRTSAWRVLPVLLLLVLCRPVPTTWFYQDDFGWLNLRHDTHSSGGLGRALLAPKAQRDNDLSEFRAALLPQAMHSKPIEVTIENPLQAPLLFGYAEVH